MAPFFLYPESGLHHPLIPGFGLYLLPFSFPLSFQCEIEPPKYSILIKLSRHMVNTVHKGYTVKSNPSPHPCKFPSPEATTSPYLEQWVHPGLF